MFNSLQNELKPADRSSWIKENPIKAARLKTTLCGKEIAYRIGVSYTGYRRWECGMRSPTIIHLGKLAEFFNIDSQILIKNFNCWKSLKP